MQGSFGNIIIRVRVNTGSSGRRNAEIKVRPLPYRCNKAKPVEILPNHNPTDLGLHAPSPSLPSPPSPPLSLRNRPVRPDDHHLGTALRHEYLLIRRSYSFISRIPIPSWCVLVPVLTFILPTKSSGNLPRSHVSNS